MQVEVESANAVESLENYQGGWDRAAVHALAVHAADAYEDTPAGGQLIDSRRTDTQAFLHDYGTHSVLAFRGTETPRMLELLSMSNPFWRRFRDVLTDLRILQDDWVGGGRVHRGFLAAFKSIEFSLEKALSELPEQSRKNLFICGHSLGGALGTLAASRFPCRMVATFGSPRVGNRRFARSFGLSNAGRYYRVVNRADVVARVPVPIRYAHCGIPIFICHDGQFWPRPGLGVRLVAFARNLMRGRSVMIADHGMEHYLQALGSEA